jgi:hypothetical protein
MSSIAAIEVGVVRRGQSRCGATRSNGDGRIGRLPNQIECDPGGLILAPIMAKPTDDDPSEYPAFVEALAEPLGRIHPTGRAGLPQDLANAALFFASDRSEFITGQDISVDGGITSVAHLDMAAVMGLAFDAMGVDVDPNYSAATRRADH